MLYYQKPEALFLRILNTMFKVTQILVSNLIILICTILCFTSCQKKSSPSAIIPQPVAAPNGKTYLALGDSYTIGQNVQLAERFPYLLTTSLRNAGYMFSEPNYIAATGWTTANLENAIGAENPPATFDIVTLLIGVNDQYQRKDTAEYRIRFTQLLHTATILAGNRPARVFVLSIPDYSATPFVPNNEKARVSREIGWFNDINKQVTLQNKIVYVDITPLSRDANTDASLLANDGLHYSAKEHQKWVDLLAPSVKKVL